MPIAKKALEPDDFPVDVLTLPMKLSRLTSPSALTRTKLGVKKTSVPPNSSGPVLVRAL